MPAAKKVIAFSAVFLAIVLYRILSNPSLALFTYIIVSYFKNFDSDVILDNNFNGEIEDEIFTHRIIHLDKTYSGYEVDVTYHAVECGDPTAEPIVFAHGLCENWRCVELLFLLTRWC
jgi:hypothetical protein